MQYIVLLCLFQTRRKHGNGDYLALVICLNHIALSLFSLLPFTDHALWLAEPSSLLLTLQASEAQEKQTKNACAIDRSLAGFNEAKKTFRSYSRGGNSGLYDAEQDDLN